MAESKQMDVFYMQRCFDLAMLGGKNTKTNPMVGCVIVYEDEIIGEGYHKQYGGPHAEVNALTSVSEANKVKLSRSTVYVSLEPCSFIGKTPACSAKLVECGFKKVVIACVDPNPKVSGKGIQYLKDHGIEVISPFLQNQGLDIISKFKANLNERPYIILKWAQSLDGYISKKGEQTSISNEAVQILVHKWRTEVDGILVGKNTAMIDNPSLTPRVYGGDHPLRIILDTNLELSANLDLYSDGEPTITFNTLESKTDGVNEFVQIEDTRNLKSILDILFTKNIFSIIVEGGSEVLKSFIKQNFWDEARVIKTQIKLRDGITAPNVEGRLTNKLLIEDNEVLYIKNKDI